MIPKSNIPGVQAVIFDIAGTTLDYGSRAPVTAVMELFHRHGVDITSDEVRRPMGTHKKDHIWALLSDPAIAARWETAQGFKPDAPLLDQLFEEFTPLQVEVIKRHCDVIPGVLDVVKELRDRNIKIANTTGYDSSMMADLKQIAVKNGYSPDLWVTPDVVGKGRPAPWMAIYAARHFDLYPMSTFVKVGDTPVDMAEGHAAGMWAVGVVVSGNEVGLSSEELAALPAAARQARISAARARLAASGPHYLIDSVADLMPVIDQITARIVRGDRP